MIPKTGEKKFCGMTRHNWSLSTLLLCRRTVIQSRQQSPPLNDSKKAPKKAPFTGQKPQRFTIKITLTYKHKKKMKQKGIKRKIFEKRKKYIIQPKMVKSQSE